jgi:hypothetical protein
VTEVTRYRRSPTELARSVGDRVILAGTDRDGFEVLEGPGAIVWALLADAVTRDEITETLAASFGAPREEIGRDVGALLRDLRRRGLVEEAERSRG